MPVEVEIETESVIENGRIIPTPPVRTLIYRTRSKTKQSDTTFIQTVTPSSSNTDLYDAVKTNDTSKRDDRFRSSNSKLKLDEGAYRTMEEDDGSSCTKKFDYEAFNDRRVMSPLQERWNALTMLPAMFYGVYFVLAGCWLTSHIENVRNDESGNSQIFNDVSAMSSWVVWASHLFRGRELEAESDIHTG